MFSANFVYIFIFQVKIALLKYLSSLIAEMDPRKFSSSNSEITFAFMKIISWTTMPKSSDIRKVCFYYFMLHFDFILENFVYLKSLFHLTKLEWYSLCLKDYEGICFMRHSKYIFVFIHLQCIVCLK